MLKNPRLHIRKVAHLMWDGAEKCLLRDLDRSEETCLFSFILMVTKLLCKTDKLKILAAFPSRYNMASRVQKSSDKKTIEIPF